MTNSQRKSQREKDYKKRLHEYNCWSYYHYINNNWNYDAKFEEELMKIFRIGEYRYI